MFSYSCNLQNICNKKQNSTSTLKFVNKIMDDDDCLVGESIAHDV